MLIRLITYVFGGQKALGASVSSAQWLLASIQRLDLCLSVGDAPNPPGCPGPSGAKLFILPSLLEFGSPSQDVWPDVPEWDEKQVLISLSFSPVYARSPCDKIAKLK